MSTTGKINTSLLPKELCCEHICKLSFCRVPLARYVYGLYDRRTENIFYVGSTFDVLKRFKEHLREHTYVQEMLERGCFPVPVLLHEFLTRCDLYSRQVEVAIARQLRQQGHSAFSDDSRCVATMDRWFYVMMEGQAAQIADLRAVWQEALNREGATHESEYRDLAS